MATTSRLAGVSWRSIRRVHPLFVGSRAGRLAEVTIPVPVRSSNPNALPFATYLQPFADPTEGRLSQVASEGVAIDGLMVYGNRLYGTASIYYDANNTQRVSHYSRSLRLNEPSFQGWSQVWEAGKAGFVSGLLAVVPEEWRARLGGPAVTGQCCIPIVMRTSWGPAAFSFDPARIGQAAVAAAPLLYYTAEHPTLGPWDASNPTYGATMTMGGLTIIPGTRTALYFGANGIGPNCYGNGTGQQSLHGTIGADGSTWCYDPTSSDKGSHAYPYHYQIWAYDLNDFAAVKAGQKQPWEVVPYGVWPFELPTPEARVRLGGVSYDPAKRTLYISQLYADQDGYASRPIIHTLQVNVLPRTVDVPAASVTIASDLPAPQSAGTVVRFTASGAGGKDPYQYKWSTYDGNTWVPRGDWTSSREFAITPTAASAQFRVGVGVRSSDNTTDVPEATNTIAFPVTGGRVSSVSLMANKTAPQPVNMPIVWTATPTGGEAPHQYQWWVHDGSTWVATGGFTAANTFTWTPATSANYRVAVWVRSAGNSGSHEASTEAWFAISASAPAAPPARTSAVSLTANRTAPQAANTTITWTAAPTGGVAPHQYQWWVFDAVNWVSQPWSTSNTFAWTPAICEPQLPGRGLGTQRRQLWQPRGLHGSLVRHHGHSHPAATAASDRRDLDGQCCRTATAEHDHHVDRGSCGRRGAAPISVVGVRRRDLGVAALDLFQHVHVDPVGSQPQLPNRGVGAQCRELGQPRNLHRSLVRDCWRSTN